MKTLFTDIELGYMWKRTEISPLPKWVDSESTNFFISRSRQELFIQMNSENKTGFLFKPISFTKRSDKGYRHIWKNAQNS